VWLGCHQYDPVDYFVAIIIIWWAPGQEIIHRPLALGRPCVHQVGNIGECGHCAVSVSFLGDHADSEELVVSC
jgi:hypothetical protein